MIKMIKTDSGAVAHVKIIASTCSNVVENYLTPGLPGGLWCFLRPGAQCVHSCPNHEPPAGRSCSRSDHRSLEPLNSGVKI